MNKENELELRQFNCYEKFLNNEGFRCQDGWFDVLYQLGHKLDRLGVKAIQVKEKFACLRVYVAPVDKASLSKEDLNALNEAIVRAEDQAAKTCEVCGSENASLVKKGYWVYRRCEKCKDDTPW